MGSELRKEGRQGRYIQESFLSQRSKKISIQVLLTLLTLQYKKDKISIILESFIEQLKGAQINANDLPHSPEVPAADTHEDHRALPQVLETKGHRLRTWSQLQHGFPYPEGSNCKGNYKSHNNGKPAKKHASDSS